MARCIRTSGLEVHHKSRTGSNDLGNAEVLCQPCHVATGTYGTSGSSPPDFSEDTKARAHQRAGHTCECMRLGCSH